MINLHQLFRVFSRVSSSPADPPAPNASSEVSSLPPLDHLSSLSALHQQELLASLAAVVSAASSSAASTGPSSATMSGSPSSLLSSSAFCVPPSSSSAKAPHTALPFPPGSSPEALAFPCQSVPSSLHGKPLSPGFAEPSVSPTDFAAAASRGSFSTPRKRGVGLDAHEGSGIRGEGLGEERDRQWLLLQKPVSKTTMRWPWLAARGEEDANVAPGSELPLSVSSFLGEGLASQQAGPAHPSPLLPSTSGFAHAEGSLLPSASSPSPHHAGRSEAAGARQAPVSQDSFSPLQPSMPAPGGAEPRGEASGPRVSQGLPTALSSDACGGGLMGADASAQPQTSALLTLLMRPEGRGGGSDVVAHDAASKENLRQNATDIAEGRTLLPSRPASHANSASLPGPLPSAPSVDLTRTTTTTSSAAPEAAAGLVAVSRTADDCGGAEQAAPMHDQPLSLNDFSLSSAPQGKLVYCAKDRPACQALDEGSHGLTPYLEACAGADPPGEGEHAGEDREEARHARGAALQPPSRLTGSELSLGDTHGGGPGSETGERHAQREETSGASCAFVSEELKDFPFPQTASAGARGDTCASFTEHPSFPPPASSDVCSRGPPSPRQNSTYPWRACQRTDEARNSEVEAPHTSDLSTLTAGSWGEGVLSAFSLATSPALPEGRDAAPGSGAPHGPEAGGDVQGSSADRVAPCPSVTSCRPHRSSPVPGTATNATALSSHTSVRTIAETGSSDAAAVPPSDPGGARDSPPASLSAAAAPAPGSGEASAFRDRVASRVDAADFGARSQTDTAGRGERETDSATEGNLPAVAVGPSEAGLSSAPLSADSAELMFLFRNGQPSAAAIVAALQQRHTPLGTAGEGEENLQGEGAESSRVSEGAEQRQSREDSASIGEVEQHGKNAQLATRASVNSSRGTCAASDVEQAPSIASSSAVNGTSISSACGRSLYASSPASSGASLTSSSTPPGLPTPGHGAGAPGGLALAPSSSAQSSPPAPSDPASLHSLLLWPAQQDSSRLPGSSPAEASSTGPGIRVTGDSESDNPGGAAASSGAGPLRGPPCAGPPRASGSGAQAGTASGAAVNPAANATTFQQQLLLLSAAFDRIGSSPFPVVGGEGFSMYNASGAEASGGPASAPLGGPATSLPVLLAGANAEAGTDSGVEEHRGLLALLGGGGEHPPAQQVLGLPSTGAGMTLGNSGAGATSRGVKRQYGGQARGLSTSQKGSGVLLAQSRPADDSGQGGMGGSGAAGRAVKKQRRGALYSGGAAPTGAVAGFLPVGAGPRAHAKDGPTPPSDEFFLQQLQQGGDSSRSSAERPAAPGSSISAARSSLPTVPVGWPSAFGDGGCAPGAEGPPSPSLRSLSHAGGVLFGSGANTTLGHLSAPAYFTQVHGMPLSAGDAGVSGAHPAPGSMVGAEAAAVGEEVVVGGLLNSSFPLSSGCGTRGALLNNSATLRPASGQASSCSQNAGANALLAGASAGLDILPGAGAQPGGPGLFFGGASPPLQEASAYTSGNGNTSSASNGDAIAAAALLHLRTLQQLQELQRHFHQRAPGGVLATQGPPTPFLGPASPLVNSSLGLGSPAPGPAAGLVCNAAGLSPMTGRGPERRATGGGSGGSRKGSGGVSAGAEHLFLLQLKQQQAGGHSSVNPHGPARGSATTGGGAGPAASGGGVVGAPQQHHPGVCYSPPKDVWRARITVDGRQHEQQFSVKRHGFEEARMLAVQWRAHMENLRLGGGGKSKGNGGAAIASTATVASQASSHSSQQPQLAGTVVSGTPGSPGSGSLSGRGL
ncbi:hypothetical protein BESB_030840 [Besnoitia besnoiti]|uniref:AP2/ERF domain-containing protein n=1 Tax=Besnoitia besnoiti TaxID=94643 RepID=A0A2A9M728_BESBE|nr:hypothetical protein BESB_030840 [Besnoitia besnoiti]PFH31210.1 hypothetical protein BESB_030840 [Besnoitia besnoiti]